MVDLKLQHILTITQILMLGGRHNFVDVTTTDLAKAIKRSQQAASKHLLELENEGYIERFRNGQKFRVRITDKGFFEIESILSIINSAIESVPDTIAFEGNVISGMGEGAYYMSLDGYRKQFKDKLGYVPYPGTLNVKLVNQVFRNAKRELSKFPFIFIEGFSDNTRTYGWAKCYLAIINNNAIKNAAILLLERTHYDDSMLEVIAPCSIKQSIGVQNGDPISLKVYINNAKNLKFYKKNHLTLP
jgi:riboflavin kinase, archaea type